MRFKSRAQRRKFAELLVKGEITPDAYERWNRDTGRAELPERLKRKRKKKARARRKSRARKPGRLRSRKTARRKRG